jgi:dephospho-CoA kinase
VKKFYVAALTGRSGTGKSYASEYLAKKGVATIDGDKVSRMVVEPGSRCLEELVKAFSDSILLEDGSLNRRKLGDMVFSDKSKKKTLNRIIHPHIIERLLSMFDALKEQGEAYCVVEAGALVESGLYAVCDKIVMITADESRQIQRIMARDKITEQQAITRLHAQLSVDEVKDLCDVIIANNGTIAEFESKLDILAGQLNAWFKE